MRISDWSSDVCSSDLLVRADGKPISVQEERLIEDGINAVMKLDVADRSLSALRSMLGMKDSSGVGARLEKWTSEGSLGWAFDNPADSMTLNARSEEHTSELQSLMRNSYAVFCLKKKKTIT